MLVDSARVCCVLSLYCNAGERSRFVYNIKCWRTDMCMQLVVDVQVVWRYVVRRGF